MNKQKSNQFGAINIWLVLTLVLSFLFLITTLFAFVTFTERNEYRDEVDDKVGVAVEVAKQQAYSEKDNEFLEREKEPFKKFQGDAAFGSLSFNYPKTWSAYLATSSAIPINVYMHPDIVDADTRNSAATSYALRAQIVEQSYDRVIRTFDTSIKRGEVKAVSYAPKNVDTLAGLRLEGQITRYKTGIMVVLPLRDKTIQIWTESPSFHSDFDRIVLETLDYTP